MCWMCDHPGSSRADYLDHVRDIMDRCGWAVQGVEREGPHPPWAYTVGLTRLGRPELVVTGMSLHRATHLLNDMAAHALHADNPKLGELVELADGPVIQMVAVAEPTAHLLIATEMFGPRIRALQVVHADDRGQWPWESGYRGVRGGQPVLGLVDPTATMPASPVAWVVPPASPAAPTDGTEPSDAPAQPGAASSRRPVTRREPAKRGPSRGSGTWRASRGPRRRSARSSPRRPSRRR